MVLKGLPTKVITDVLQNYHDDKCTVVKEIINISNYIDIQHDKWEKFVIHYKNAKSREFKIINGLQQGTVNPPTLFNLYMLDKLNYIDNISSFADDI